MRTRRHARSTPGRKVVVASLHREVHEVEDVLHFPAVEMWDVFVCLFRGEARDEILRHVGHLVVVALKGSVAPAEARWVDPVAEPARYERLLAEGFAV